jgi:hypothetical protein
MTRLFTYALFAWQKWLRAFARLQLPCLHHYGMKMMPPADSTLKFKCLILRLQPRLIDSSYSSPGSKGLMHAPPFNINKSELLIPHEKQIYLSFGSCNQQNPALVTRESQTEGILIWDNAYLPSRQID